MLTRRHFISLNSNLTHSSFSQFAESIDPARVSFINAGLHLEERDQRGDSTRFIDHATVLQDNGFRLLISLVATPKALLTGKAVSNSEIVSRHVQRKDLSRSV